MHESLLKKFIQKHKTSNPRARIAFVALLVCALVLGAFGILGVAGVAPGLKGCTNTWGKDGSARYRNALYIYMCGSTLETKSSIATSNIQEMLGVPVSSDTAIVIETGGTRKWRNYDIPSDALVRYEIRAGQLIEIGREADASMGDAQTLTSFLDFCGREYSAENTTLLLWNHGAGSVKGVCLDETHNMDGLSAAKLNQALDSVDAHFTNICFDACLMAGYETMRVVAPHAEHMVASEEIEPAAGWDYTTLLKNLGNANLSEELLSAYKTKNEAKGKRLYTLSAVDLTKFAQVDSAFEAFCEQELTKKGTEEQLQEVVQAAADAMGFGNASSNSSSTSSKGSSQTNFVDLVQFSQNLGFETLAQAAKSCIQTANGADREGASGISIFFPFDTSTSLKDYLSSATNSSYSLFLRTYFSSDGAGAGEGGAGGGGSAGGTSAGADGAGAAGSTSSANTAQNSKIEFLDSGSVDGSMLNFSISSQSTRYVQEVAYAIYQLDHNNDEDNSQADCLGFSDDIVKRSTSAYSINFNGKWVALNGHLLFCDTIDSTGDTTVFSSPIKLNGEEGELRFTFNAKTKSYSLQGFIANEEAGTQGRLEDIQQDDTITILAEQFKDAVSTETQLIETATISAADGLELSSKTLPNGRYHVYGTITDIYGNEHETRDFIVTFTDGAVAEVKVS